MKTLSVKIGADTYSIRGLTLGQYFSFQDSAKNLTDLRSACELQASLVAAAIHNPGSWNVGVDVLDYVTFDELKDLVQKVLSLTLPQAEGSDAAPLVNGNSGT